MATGRTPPLTGGTRAGNWKPSKDLGSYDPLPPCLSVPDRYGSAPPGMEGNSAGLDHVVSQQSGNLEATLKNLGCGPESSKSEDQLLSVPEYFRYYNSKVKLNPRVHASKESRGLMNMAGKTGEWMPSPLDDSGRSLTSCSTLSKHKVESEDAGHDSGQITSNLASHSSNVVKLIQENFPRSTVLYDSCSDHSNTNCDKGGSVCSGINSSKNSALDNIKSPNLNGFSPDTHQCSPKRIGTPLRNTLGSSALAAPFPFISSSSDHSTAMQQEQNNALSQNGPSHLVHGDPIQITPRGTNLPVPFVNNFSHAPMRLHSGDIQVLPQFGLTTPYTHSLPGSPYSQNLQFASLLSRPLGIDGHGLHSSFSPPFVTNFALQRPVMTPFDTLLTPSCSGGRLADFPSTENSATGAESLNPQLGVAMPPPIPNLSPVHYFQQPSMQNYGVENKSDTVTSSTSFVGNYPAAIYDSQKVLSETTKQSEQKFQLPNNGASSSPRVIKGGDYAGNDQSTPLYINMQMPHPTSQMFQGQPSSGTFPRDRRNDAPEFQSLSEASPGTQGKRRTAKPDPKARSFVGELKFNKNQRVDLSGITGRMLQCCSDQNGSRFIQQKLDNCTAEEKALLFAKIIPHASSLMTDVFGNYVIQKCFEQGNPEQRRDLAKKMAGRVLPLSLQMYGCRVFQKALEAIELDQKVALVRELDGHVLRCVRDQNGNHVIQKCIECVPVEHTVFVISAFQGQVVRLSKHPYGCRVIQRILEHCGNASEGIMDEILQSACILAQDQYGNYVTQHVVEKGKAHERSEIICRLAGQVVCMSHNKYASNVIEKCFQHGNVAERDLLIKEILKQTEGNNSLLVMMKDKFANYVIQKILETCNDQQTEALVGRMKCHLEVLRNYTYGKHITSRIEQFYADDGDVPPEP